MVEQRDVVVTRKKTARMSTGGKSPREQKRMRGVVVGKGKSARMSSKGKHPAKRMKRTPANELVTSAKLTTVCSKCYVLFV